MYGRGEITRGRGGVGKAGGAGGGSDRDSEDQPKGRYMTSAGGNEAVEGRVTRVRKEEAFFWPVTGRGRMFHVLRWRQTLEQGGGKNTSRVED